MSGVRVVTSDPTMVTKIRKYQNKKGDAPRKHLLFFMVVVIFRPIASISVVVPEGTVGRVDVVHEDRPELTVGEETGIESSL